MNTPNNLPAGIRAPITTELVIDGQLVSAVAGERLTTIDPASGRPIAAVARAGVADVDAAVAAADNAFPAWAAASPGERSALLFRFADEITADAEELATIESLDAGKPIVDARGEIASVIAVLRYYAGAIDKLIGSTVPVDAQGLAMTLREPIGVVALITPWNFPLAIANWKCASALAAGNTIVLKPAELTPLSALRYGELALRAGVPAGVLNVIPGPGGSVGARLAEHPRVAKVGFTGSGSVGVDVQRRAAATVKRVTLELGGKSACLVFADADLERVGQLAPLAMFGNAGQDCCARSRLIVAREVADELLERYLERTRALVTGPPAEEETEIGPLISDAQRTSVHSFVERGTEEGATLLCGGGPPEELSGEGFYYAPTILTGVDRSNLVAREEIFGPVLSVLTFSTEEEGIELANDTPFGLSGSIWTRDGARAIRASRAIRTGALSVNSNSSLFPQLPFGGYGRSGIGKELGMEGLIHNTQLKSVFFSSAP